MKDILTTDHEKVKQIMNKISKTPDPELFVELKSLEAHIFMKKEDIFDLNKKYFSNEQTQKMGEDIKKEKRSRRTI
jgi:hypothetical protein